MLLKLTPGLNRLLEEAAADQTLSQVSPRLFSWPAAHEEGVSVIKAARLFMCRTCGRRRAPAPLPAPRSGTQ